MVLSIVYRWFYALYLREGVVADYFSNAYHGTIGCLPWTVSLQAGQTALCSIRNRFMEACRFMKAGKEVLAERLAQTGVVTLQQVIQSREELRLRWGSQTQATESEDSEPVHSVPFGSALSDWVEVNDALIAEQLALAVTLFIDGSATRDDIRNLILPANGTEQEYAAVVADYKRTEPTREVERILAELDTVVAPALGVSENELDFMREDLKKDPLLSKLRMRLPYQEKTVRGLLESLLASDRYQQISTTRSTQSA